MQGPGPIAPLTSGDSNHVLQLLLGALSQDTTVQKQAESVLSALEQRPGYSSCLVAIIGNPEAEHSARWLASVQLKNSVSKFWRPRHDQRGITPEEKAYLRQHILHLIGQDDNQIAVQTALVVAKAARFDYPRDWPSLFNDLLGQVHGGDKLTVRRVYFVLHHVLKELSSKRLVADQKNFAEITQLLFQHIWDQWCSDLNTILPGLPAALAEPSQAQPLLMYCERWLTLLKIVRRLLLFGFPSDARSLAPVAAVNTCGPAMLRALHELQALRPAKAPKSQLLAMLDRGILKLMKTLSQVQETHPWSYHHAGLLLPSLELCYSQLLSSAPEIKRSREPFLIQCMLFVLGVMRCDGYKGRTGSILTSTKDSEQAATVEQLSKEVQSNLQSFWSSNAAAGQPRLHALTQALVQTYFPLTARELDEWETDSEAFFHSLEGGSWQDHLRLCAENLCLTLLREHRDTLSPVVVQLLHAASSSCPAGTPPNQLPGPHVRHIPAVLLLKEAVYNAVAVGAYELHDYIDFTLWLKTTLLQEMSATHPEAKPLRRACAKVMGQWVAQLKVEDRPDCYRALVILLADDDTCLKLSAVAALRTLIDDFGFANQQFVEFVGPVMTLLTAVLRASSELDTQTQVFSLLNLIIERLGQDIRPFVDIILPLLPQVWQEGEGQSLLRIQVLSALQHLINVLGQDSPMCYSLLLPLLQHSLDPANSKEPELLEDGLQLWLVALRNAPAAQPPLLQLFHYLISIMAASTEYIALGMQLISSLLLLGGAQFIQQYAADLSSVFVNYLGNVNERGMLVMFPPMDLLLLCYPSEAPQLLQAALQKLLGLLLGGQESNTVVANALGLFARLLLQNPGAFEQLLGSCAAAGLQPPSSYQAPAGLQPAEKLLGALIDLWCDRFDAIAVPVARKLSGLGLCSMLGIHSKVVLTQLDVIISHVTSVWIEVEKSGEDDEDGMLYCSPLYYTGRADEDGISNDSLLAAEEATGEVTRRQAVLDAEPVKKLKISQQLRSMIQACATIHGQEFQIAMGRVDPAITGQMHAIIG